MTSRLDLTVLLVGAVLLIAGVALVDWRAGLALAGALLILSALDIRGPHR